MLLGNSFIAIVGALFLIGLIGFFVMSVVLLARVIGAALRGITGGVAASPAPARFDDRREGCPHPRCGHVNQPDAKFCGRCGRPLTGESDVDAYG